jgi:hypothetical protein
VSFPTPEPGLVIRYSYLWQREAEAGREDGLKERPCAIVLNVRNHEGRLQVTVLPITHAPPAQMRDAIEIPAPTKRRLGLDEQRSSIVMTEANQFLWPGPDLRPFQNGDLSTIVFGVLPPNLFLHLLDKYLGLDRTRKVRTVKRTE